MGNSFDYQTRRIIRIGLAGFTLVPALSGWAGPFSERYALGIAYTILAIAFVWEYFDKKV